MLFLNNIIHQYLNHNKVDPIIGDTELLSLH